jgi:hypothetical protein
MFARLNLMTATLVMALLGSACTDGPPDVTDNDAGEFVDCVQNAVGGCVLDSEACSADTIAARGDGMTCATCTDESGDVEICGASIEARCVQQENAFGDACQRCVTDDGQILYDDCFGPNAQTDDLLCESAGLSGPMNPEDPEGPPSLVIDETTECEVCRDANGQVVSTRCAPVADSCAEIEVAGRMCLECTTDGVVIYRKCDPLDIDPRFCVSYADDDGICVDCYGQNDELLTHECVVGGTGISYCEDERTPEGYVCSRCYGTSGLLLEEQCYFSPPSALRCQELIFTDQTCVACVGEVGELLSLDCYSNGCAESPDENAACPPPAPCEMIFGDDGSICRVCSTMQDNERVEELQCIDQGGLVCFEEVNYVEGSDGDPNAPDGALIAQHCVVCFDEEVEVYRSCEDVGVAPPPVCEYYDNFAGELCETCFDQQTGDVVYSSCSGAPVCYDETDADGQLCTTCYDSLSGDIVESSCGAQVCSGVAGLVVTDIDGQPVKHPGTETHVELLADCSMCNGNTDADQLTTCSVVNACVDPATGAPGVMPDPTQQCGNLVNVSLDVVQCGRPWGDGYADIDEAMRIIAWGAVDIGVLFHSATLSWSAAGGEMCEACDCLSGQRLDVVVDEASVGALLNAPFGFVLN